MRALITGGAGFIGSHLAEALLDAGHTVTILDDLSTGRVDNLAAVSGHRRLSCVFDTVLDTRVLAPLVAKADVVFHLAAAVGVRLVVNAPIHTIDTNIDGTSTVLREAARHGTLVVVASTSEVYGKSPAIPFTEEADLLLGPSSVGRWGYAASKLVDEFLALAYWKERQLPTIVLRFFNSVGPRQSSRYGMVLPNFVRQAIDNEPLTVHGDGSQRRCFTWVGDVVASMVSLVETPSAVGQVFNIGNDDEISIRDLAFKVKALAGSESPISFIPYDQVFNGDFEDMPRRVPDISKLRACIGYRPRVALEEIIVRTIDYWRAARPVETSAACPRPRVHRHPAIAPNAVAMPTPTMAG